ncbi:hypothetical protein A2U01_0034148 [Trifolium medium]|uniref:Uncharacterized protein n=1 Tax=Trifolium medium TaxID=97028 RepID=A0A392PP15_9FABA|nr:hypothetical protein [Trifolium medium]
MRGAVEDTVVGGGPFFGDLQWRITFLPIKAGGLGLYSAVEASSYDFVASRARSWVLQDHILRDSVVCGMDYDFDSALDDLRDTIQTFDFNNFTIKDIVPPKAQHILASAVFSGPCSRLSSTYPNRGITSTYVPGRVSHCPQICPRSTYV